MGFQQICENAVVENDGALGCVLIDLRTGLTLASARRRGAELDGAEMKTVLRSCEDLFCGRLIGQFVAALSTERPSLSGFVREVQITKTHHYQFMAALPGWDDAVVILITEKTLSLGLAWMVVHQTQTQLAQARRNVGDDRLDGPDVAFREDAAQAWEGAARVGEHEPAADVHAASVAPPAPSPAPPVEPPASARAPASPERQAAPESREAADSAALLATVAPPAPAAAPVSPKEPAMPAATAADDEVSRPQRIEPVVSAPEAEEASESGPESPRAVAAGARASMFRPRGSKKKRGS